MQLRPIIRDLIILAIAIPVWFGFVWLIDNAQPAMTVIAALLIGYLVGKAR